MFVYSSFLRWKLTGHHFRPDNYYSFPTRLTIPQSRFSHGTAVPPRRSSRAIIPRLSRKDEAPPRARRLRSATKKSGTPRAPLLLPICIDFIASVGEVAPRRTRLKIVVTRLAPIVLGTDIQRRRTYVKRTAGSRDFFPRASARVAFSSSSSVSIQHVAVHRSGCRSRKASSQCDSSWRDFDSARTLIQWPRSRTAAEVMRGALRSMEISSTHRLVHLPFP